MTETTENTLAAAISRVSAEIRAGQLPRRLCPSCGWFWRCCTCRPVAESLKPMPEPLREHTVMKTAEEWAALKR